MRLRPGIGKNIAAAMLPALAVVVLASLSGCSGGGPAVLLSPVGERLGPIGPETPFDAGALQALFPDLQVVAEGAMSEGIALPVLRVMSGEVGVVEVRPTESGGIGSVEILEGARLGPDEPGFGDRFDAVYAEGSAPRCVPALEELSGDGNCASPGSEHLRLIFEGEWSGPDDQLPPPAVLREWTVGRMFWIP